MIAIIDYGMGNLRSVKNAFDKLGAEAEIISDAERLSLADKAVLPGVGAFKDTMDGIEERGLKKTIYEFVESGKPYLGICMGLQVLFEESAEGGRRMGFGILKGKVKRFRPKRDLKVPHMGWNQIKLKTIPPMQAYGQEKAGKTVESPLLKGITDGSYFYFDHSYYAAPKNKDVIAGTTDYGLDFASVIWRGNIYAVQFHPEKSQDTGLRMLRNFIEIC